MWPHRNPNRWPCEAHLDHLGCRLSSASEQCSQTREMTTACPNWWSPVRDHHMLFHSDPFKFPVCLLGLSASLDALLESRNRHEMTDNKTLCKTRYELTDLPTSLHEKNTICKVSYSAYLSFQATSIEHRRSIFFPSAQIILCLFHNS